MKIIIQNDVKTKLYEDLMKAGINEIKGACFAYNSSPNVFEIEEVYISPVHGTFAFSNLIICSIPLLYPKAKQPGFYAKLSLSYDSGLLVNKIFCMGTPPYCEHHTILICFLCVVCQNFMNPSPLSFHLPERAGHSPHKAPLALHTAPVIIDKLL